MPVRVKVPRRNSSLLWRLVRGALIVGGICVAVFAVIFFAYYHHYATLVDERLAQGPLFASVAQIYAAPEEVRSGQQLSAANIAARLRRAGYNNNPQLGTYQVRDESIFIKPGPQSYLATDGATIATSGDVVQSITAENGVALAGYKLEPQLITALSEDKNRTKRRLVTYNQIPKRMVQAVVAIEDHRFFEHGGINYVRTVKCAVQDIFSGRKECGGSTITQQLARGFFLTPQKAIKRKLEEIMITYQLENRFTKEQIFEMYANQINIGQRGSYGINGFGEAAQAYFGKNLSQLDTAECALIAGLIQNPNRRNPYRHPDRAMSRRNLVIDQMVQTDAITADEGERAKAEPLRLAPVNIDASEAPYFVDLVHDQLVQRVSEQELTHDSLRIYTSLDPELQRAATEAVEAGMRNVDELIRRRHRHPEEPITYPQVSLIALNPHTGQVLALVGGRNYGTSQLNHVTAERPTGSTFKPFVYAAAFRSSLEGTNLGGNGVFNALTKINDDQQDFGTDGRSYTPNNFVHGEYPGMVTAADALAHSLNIATIALAQMVGYDNVASLARSAGIVNAKATPSMAIGTYNATPLALAGAYTVFANGGVHLKPWLLSSVRNSQGDIVADFAPEASQVLDPRAAFLTQSLMEGVINRGTAIAVRKLGFTAPAAGKTGTEHDSWFAGYTSNLLTIVWIGNDDYTDIKLQGADAAAPIWAGFMNRAIRLPQYSDMKAFTAPEGVQVLRINRATSLPVDETCPSDNFAAAFLIGTAPQGTCSHMGEDTQTLAGKLFGSTGNNDGNQVIPSQQPGSPSSAPSQINLPNQPGQPSQPTQANQANQPPADPNKHRNIFQKIFGLGKDKASQQQEQQPPQ